MKYNPFGLTAARFPVPLPVISLFCCLMCGQNKLHGYPRNGEIEINGQGLLLKMLLKPRGGTGWSNGPKVEIHTGSCSSHFTRQELALRALSFFFVTGQAVHRFIGRTHKASNKRYRLIQGPPSPTASLHPPSARDLTNHFARRLSRERGRARERGHLDCLSDRWSYGQSSCLSSASPAVTVQSWLGSAVLVLLWQGLSKCHGDRGGSEGLDKRQQWRSRSRGVRERVGPGPNYLRVQYLPGYSQGRCY